MTYHIQTEDKGLKTPLILSLVYHGGTILASKRSPYDDLIETGFDEAVLEERVQRQHKLICAAVRAGRIEDLKRMTMKESQREPAGLVASKKSKVAKTEAPAIEKPKKEVPAEAPVEVPMDLLEEIVWDIPIEDIEIVDTIIADGNTIIEEEIILPADAVKVIGALDRFDPFVENELKVKIMGNDVFSSGDRKNVNVLVCRGREETAVAEAGIMIKVLGSDFRPQIFHAVADNNGVAAVSVSIPEFRSGRAAILVRAMVGNEEAEIRRAISQERR